MRPRLRSVRLGVAIALLLGAATPTRSFQFFRHVYMTEQVLERAGVDEATLEFIKVGTYMPDVGGCLAHCNCPEGINLLCDAPSKETVLALSLDHFDNTRIEQSRDRVNERVDWARRMLLQLPIPLATDADREQYANAMEIFGEALHAIQDFYAHSNWVECHRGRLREQQPIPLWEGLVRPPPACEARAIGGVALTELHTGFYGVEPTEAQHTTHDVLNKDSPSSDQGRKEVLGAGGRVLSTYYTAVSGQQQSNGPYRQGGLAPRHTQRAYEALLDGTAVFLEFPLAPAPRHRSTESGLRIRALIAAAEADPAIRKLARERGAVIDIETVGRFWSRELSAKLRPILDDLVRADGGSGR